MIGETRSAGPVGIEAPATTEAFVALLILGARADGEVSPNEANQIELVASTMKLFRGTTGESRRGIFVAAAERIKEHGANHVLDEAARKIPKELAATTFALAVDLMLSDGRLTPNEQRFADDLRTALHVERDMAQRIVEVLTIKNAG